MNLEDLRLVRNISLFFAITLPLTFLFMITAYHYAFEACSSDPKCEIRGFTVNEWLVIYALAFFPSGMIGFITTIFLQSTNPQRKGQ